MESNLQTNLKTADSSIRLFNGETNSSVYTVSELNQAVRGLLEQQFHAIWVEGEISNLKVPRSGHAYFSLKDDSGQVRCAMFKHQILSSQVELTEGMRVHIRATVSIYPDRGDYQLLVTKIINIGVGPLQQQYEKLLQKLAKAGLFQSKWKKPIPKFPQQIGVITSATGAAIRDVLSVLKRRAPGIPIILYPSEVQGHTAVNSLLEALNAAIEHNVCDVLVITRGGGSLEDLWCFNDEVWAKAIFDCPLPIVSGVGHEIDFTITDLVADQRAATPSAAAELVSPNQQELIRQIQQYKLRNFQALKHLLTKLYQRLDYAKTRLKHPQHQIQSQLQVCIKSRLQLLQALNHVLLKKRDALASLQRTLETASPVATLTRGYSIATVLKNNTLLRDSKTIKPKDEIKLQLATGELICQVTKILN